MFWDEVIESEKEYLAAVLARIKQLNAAAKRMNHPDLDSIIAGACESYKIAKASLDSMISDLRRLQAQMNAGQLPAPQPAIAPGRVRSALISMGAMRCLKPKKPHQIFEEEMQRQNEAMMARVNALLNDPNISDEALEQFIEHIAAIMCSVDLPFTDATAIQPKEKESILPKIAIPAFSAFLGWKASDLYAQYRRGEL